MDGAAMFDLGDTNLLLPLLRGAFVAALFSAFGASLFLCLVAPQGLKLIGAPEVGAIEGHCLRLVRASLAAALFALLGWLVLEASDMSDAANAANASRRFQPCCSARASATISSPRRFRCAPRSCFSRRGRSDGGLQPWGWRVSPLCLRRGNSHAFAMGACCSMRKHCTSLPAVPGSADCCRC
jgi:hypothetical protein